MICLRIVATLIVLLLSARETSAQRSSESTTFSFSENAPVWIGVSDASPHDPGLLITANAQTAQAAEHQSFLCTSCVDTCDRSGGGGCCGGLLTRPSLTNNLFGAGPRLAENGVLVDASWTMFYQGVASGGAQRISRFGNKVDLFLIADSEKLGWWKGGQLQIHAVDWQFGQNAILEAAGLAPVNMNLLTPKAEPSFAVTNLSLMQQLGGGWAASVGRYNALDLWTAFYPDYGRGVDGFMNIATAIPLSLLPSVPFISNSAGILKMGERGIEAGFFVLESQNSPTTVGLNFPNGVTMLGVGRLYSDFGGLPGSHTLAATYATGDYTSFDTSGWVFVPGAGIVPAEKAGTWSAVYLAEQRLWVDPCNQTRYTKAFGYVGVSDNENSPFAVTASASLEAFGAIRSRPNDRMGIAYFYSGLNSDFQNAFNLLTPIGDVHGGEVYYNFQLTPWFNLTFDLQAVEPSIEARDTAVVVGARGKLKF